MNIEKVKTRIFFISSARNSHDNKLLNSLQIFIPLHNTPLVQGPTILYKRNMIDYDLLRNSKLTNKIDDDIIKKNPELLNMFFQNILYNTKMYIVYFLTRPKRKRKRKRRT